MAPNIDSHNIALNLLGNLKRFEPTSKDNPPNSDSAFELLKDYDNAVGVFFKLKAQNSTTTNFSRYQEVILSTSHELLKFRSNIKEKYGYREWILDYRTIWKRNLELFYFCLALFSVSMIVGWSIGVSEPSFVPLIVPQYLMEQIIDHTSWFAKLQEDPLMGGLGIAINNIRVATVCFLLGSVLGIGGMVLLCFNGLLFGTVFGYCMSRGFHRELFDFVLSHGFLELTIIIASAFAGLLLGRVFYQRPYSKFGERIRCAAREAGIVATGVVPWLILAAFFEGFVSPFHYFTTEIKLLLGVTIGVLFIFWTFKPTISAKK